MNPESVNILRLWSHDLWKKATRRPLTSIEARHLEMYVTRLTAYALGVSVDFEANRMRFFAEPSEEKA
jgi:hypothetical protein